MELTHVDAWEYVAGYFASRSSAIRGDSLVFSSERAKLLARIKFIIGCGKITGNELVVSGPGDVVTTARNILEAVPPPERVVLTLSMHLSPEGIRHYVKQAADKYMQLEELLARMA